MTLAQSIILGAGLGLVGAITRLAISYQATHRRRPPHNDPTYILAVNGSWHEATGRWWDRPIPPDPNPFPRIRLWRLHR